MSDTKQTPLTVGNIRFSPRKLSDHPSVGKNLTLPIREAAQDPRDARIKELETALIEQANQLDKWATESREGGWSTHQVDPMKKKADELRRIATKR